MYSFVALISIFMLLCNHGHHVSLGLFFIFQNGNSVPGEF